jgi:hypothetical protein
LFSDSTALPPGLVQAYRETHYRVLGDDGFTLTIDVPSPELARVHRRHGVDSSAFLTACNPLCDLGTRFEQNAIVWAGADAVPRLVLLR